MQLRVPPKPPASHPKGIARTRSISSLPRPNAGTATLKPPPPPRNEAPPPPPPETSDSAPPALPPSAPTLEERERRVAERELRVAQRERELDAWQARLELQQREADSSHRPAPQLRVRATTTWTTSSSPPAVTASSAPPPLPQMELPEGWGESHSANGSVVYYDVFTHHEQTEKPTEPSMGWTRMRFARQRAALRRMETSVDLTANPEVLRKLQSLKGQLPPSVPAPAAPVNASAEQQVRLVRELYETERSFNDGVKLALVYRDALQARVANGSLPELKRDELSVVFHDSLADVAEFSTDLLKALAASYAAPATAPLDQRPGAVLVRFAPKMTVFADYLVSYQRSSDMLKEISKRPAVEKAIADVRAQNASGGGGGKLMLTDLLIMPVQRCPRYELLVGALVGSTAEGPEREQLIAAREQVRAANERNDDRLAEAHNEATIIALQAEILNCPPLMALGRQYLLRNTMVRSSPPHRPKDRVTHTFILFNDLLLETEALAKPSGGAKLRLVATLQITSQTSCRLLPPGVVADNELARAFYLRYGPKGQLEDAFIAPSVAAANAWTQAVESLLG